MEKNVLDETALNEVSGGLRGLLKAGGLFTDQPLLANLSEESLARLALAKDENELRLALAEEGIKDLPANDLARLRLALSKDRRII